MNDLTALIETAPDPIRFSMEEDVLQASFSVPDLFPDAAIDVPVFVPRDPWLTTGLGVRGRMKQAFAPISFERPIDVPAPGFWSVYGHQRGLSVTKPTWIRDRAFKALGGSSMLAFPTVLEGTVIDQKWSIASCIQRPRGRSRLKAFRPHADRAFVVLATDLPKKVKIEDQVNPPSMNHPLGWAVHTSSFIAWMRVPAAAATAQGVRSITPVVTEAMLDWACLQAVHAARACTELSA